MDIAKTRTLRVTLDGDSSGYVQAMNEKVAADKAAAASGKEVSSSNQEVGASFTSTTTKLSQSGDILSRLQRQYVDGVAAAQKFNTAIATLGRGIESGNVQMAQASDILDGIYKKFGMMANATKLAERGQLDLAKAVEQANVRLTEQQKRQPGANQNVNHYQAVNVAYQAQDTITQAFGGSSPATIALQQGPQLAMALSESGAGGAGALRTLGAGLASLLSLTNLASIGFVAFGAAAIQAAMKIYGQTKPLSELLKDQETIVKRLADAYGGVAEQAAKAGGESKRLIDAQGTQNQLALRLSAQSEANSFFGSSNVGRTLTGGRYGDRGVSYNAIVPQFQEALTKLRSEMKAGKPDFDGFYEAISQKVALDPSLSAVGAKVIAESEKFKQATDALKEYKRVQDALFNDRGPGGQLLSQGTTNTADVGNYALYQSQQRVALARSRQSFDAQLAEVNARGTTQRVAAARGMAAAQYNNDESPAQRSQRVDQAGLMAQAQAEKAIADAQRERSLSLQKLLDDQQFEISLVGKTADQAALLRKEYDLTSQIKMQAARDGNDADQKELDGIRQKIQELDKLQQAYKALSTGVTQRGFVLGSPAEQDYFDYTDSQRLSLDQGKDTFNAQVASTRARTIAERVAAARQTAEAQNPAGESAPQREQRISQATQLAQIQAEQQLRDAQRERKIALDQTIQDQQMELSLIGKVGGEAAALRKEYELTSQVRLEAAKNGTTVDQAELDLIKQKSAELGKLTDAYNKAKLTNDLTQERAQIFRSPIDQQIATRLQSAGQPVDLQSNEAQMIRQNLQTAAMKDSIKGFFTDFQGELIKNGGKVGDAFGAALKNSLMNALTKIGDQAMDKIANFLVAALTGGGAGTSGSVGSATASLLSGGIGGKVLSAANQNVGTAVSTGSLSLYGSAIKSIESSNNYSALGALTKSGDRAYGAYQVMGANIPSWTKTAVGQSMTPSQFLANPSAQDSVFNHYFGASVSKYGNPQDAASVWFTGRPQALGAAAADVSGVTGTQYVDRFNSALSKLTGTTNQATQGVGALGSGLGQLGQQLGSAGSGLFPAAPAASGGGGLFGWLGNLFGGYKAPTNTISSQWNAAASGKIFGLFADGTDFAPGGSAIVGERGPELVNLPRGSQVVPTHKTQSMFAAAANGNSSAGRQKVDVGVTVDNDGNLQAYVKKVSQQHADEAVATGLYNHDTGMRRGGLGTLQSRYSSQKG